jgi:hypothetical protein
MSDDHESKAAVKVRHPVRTAALLALALVAGVLSSVLPAIVLPSPVAAADTTAATGSAGLFVPATGRLLDTRSGTGGYTTPMPANVVRSVPAAGVVGIPAGGVSAVALTLTAVGAASAGAVSVAPGDVASPTGTALVFNPGDSVSNTDLVALHADGALHVLSNAAVNLIIDVQGYFTAGSIAAPGGFVPLDQARVVDTRSGLNVAPARVANGVAITVTAAGLAGVPGDASAVYVNIAVLGQTSNGYLRAYAADAAVPATGALGFDDSSQAESVAIPLSDGGAFTVLVGAGGPVDLLIDVQGYFTAGASSGGFTPATVHLLDTRAAPVRTLAGNGVLTLAVAGVAGIPAVGSSLTAVALTVRTVQAASGPASGFLRLWPSDQPEPAISSLNYTSQNVYRTDLVIVAPAADGTIKLHNGGPAPVDVVIDVQGWFADSGPAMPLVDSADYPEGGWGPPASGSSTFVLSDDAAGSAPQSYQYALDGAALSTLAGSAATLSLPIPPTLGLHTLAVTAIDRYGLVSATNDYDFNIGTAPAAPATLAVTSGAAAIDLSWTSGAENGAPTLGFGFSLNDLTTAAAPQNLGSCAGCSHFVITGLDPAHSYNAAVWAISAAGNSPTSTTAPFTANGADPVQCADSDESCAEQDSQQPAPSNLPYQNYDLSGDTTATSGTVPAQTDSTAPSTPITDPQCAQPTDQRTGNWVCPISDSSPTGPGSAQLDNTAPSGGGNGGGSCDYTGSCFAQRDAFTASWSGTVEYGTRVSGLLGYATLDITWQLIGAQSWSSTVKWKATSQTRDVLFTAALYNGAPGVPHGGSMLHGSYAVSPSTAVAGPGTTISWRPNGYKAYDNRHWDHNVLTEVSWSVPGAPGYFWMYLRSPCSHTTVLGTRAAYRFGSSLKFPGDLKRAGWSW